MIIGTKVLKTAGDMLTNQLLDYAPEIDKAFCIDNNMSISLSVKLALGTDGVTVETNISFTTEKIKDRSIMTVDEKQMPLFGDMEVKVDYVTHPTSGN